MPPNLLGLGEDFVYTKRDAYTHQLQEGNLKVYTMVLTSRTIEMAVYGPYNPEIVLQFEHVESDLGPTIHLNHVRMPPTRTGTVPLLQQRDPMEFPEDLVYSKSLGHYTHIFTKQSLRIIVQWVSGTVVDISVWAHVGERFWTAPDLKLQFERIMVGDVQHINLVEVSQPKTS